MNWDDIHIFLCVSKEKSFSKAAKHNRTTQATISRRIQKFENQLGCALFERGQDGCTLTGAGAALLQSAKQMQEWAQVFESDAKRLNNKQKPIVITCGPMLSYLLSTHLDALKKGIGDTNIEIKATPTDLDLDKKQADIALRNQQPASRVTLNVKSLNMRFFSEFCIYGHSDYFYDLRLSDTNNLNDYTWAGYTENLMHLPSAQWLSRHVSHEKIQYKLSSSPLMIEVIKNHKALAILPQFVGRVTPNLTEIYGPIEALSSDLWMVRQDNAHNHIKLVSENIEKLLIQIAKQQ